MAAMVAIRPTETLSERDLALISHLRAQIDYGMPSLAYQWAPKTWRVLVWRQGQLASHVGIVERVVSVGGHSVQVGGVSGVWTVHELRGQGLGSTAMRAAAEFIRSELRADFGLLLCGEHVRPFYDRLGWHSAPSPLVFEQPTGKVTWPMQTMVLRCGQVDWPAGIIDLCGLPW